MKRRTRILATLGPTSDSVEGIAALIEAGADAFRLNFSHGTRELHALTCQRIREVAAAKGRVITILQDLSGPKIRIGSLKAPVPLAVGAPLTIRLGDFTGSGAEVSCSFHALFASARPGDRLLIDDGRIEVVIETASADALTVRVAVGGLLESRKGINVPGVRLRTSAVTEKDLADLTAGIAMGVDAVAVSFVQTAEDILAARAAAVHAGAFGLPIIAKIEKPLAVEHLDDIVDVADGIMVARGDLGIELPLETLPAVQKRIVMAARRRGVPVILATQVLDSMRTEVRPTRAEVTDAAHAVDEGVDAVMLAAETAVGRHPAHVVQTLDMILTEAERSPAQPLAIPDPALSSAHAAALGEAAVALASRSGAAAIVAVTEAGQTARMLAALRPAAPILAATFSRQTAARLGLVWGVTSVLVDDSSHAAVRDVLMSRGLVPAASVVVFVSVDPALTREGRNYVQVERVG